MHIIVEFKHIWGKDLFYPVSDDAKFLADMTEKTTLSKNQLILCRKRGWTVEAITKTIDLNEMLKESE